MNSRLSLDEWKQKRLENYAEKLRLSKRKALNRLWLLVGTGDLVREFDRICDARYRSNNEPGISYERRKVRTQAIYTPRPKPQQLKLF